MKNDIDKIDEQIEAIQNAKKRKPKSNGAKVVGNISSTDTKKLDRIDNIVKHDTSINENGDTKRFDTVEVESNSSQEEEIIDSKIPAIYIICGIIIVLLIIVLCLLLIMNY